MATATRSYEVIQLLHRHQVDYIIVGMTAGVLQGAPAVTFDLDILYSLDSSNVERLFAALQELDAVFRGDPRGLRPDESHLESTGHKLLETKLGVVDVLGALGHERYEDLVGNCVELEISKMAVRVLSLEQLIEAKRTAGREKDLAVLPLLEATLARSREK